MPRISYDTRQKATIVPKQTDPEILSIGYVRKFNTDEMVKRKRSWYLSVFVTKKWKLKLVWRCGAVGENDQIGKIHTSWNTGGDTSTRTSVASSTGYNGKYDTFHASKLALDSPEADVLAPNHFLRPETSSMPLNDENSLIGVLLGKVALPSY